MPINFKHESLEFYYAFEIIFKGVEFDHYGPASDPVAPKHHAHLTLRENEVELKIFFKSKTHFDRKFAEWLSHINRDKLGSHILCENEKRNDDLQKIDFSASAMLTMHIGEKLDDEGHRFAFHFRTKCDYLIYLD